MDVSCCVLSGRGLCDELTTRSEESYRLWCVVVCDLENLKKEEAMTHVGSQRHNKKNIIIIIIMTRQSQMGRGHLIVESSRSHLDTPQSAGLLWTSDQPDTETFT